MCGICAGIGKKNEIKNVVIGLKKLEYRGYDSSGIAFLNGDKIDCIKSVGQIKNLEQKLTKLLNEKVVIGHTRWATHGEVSEENAHPHISANGEFALVHNGIVENFEELKKEMSVDFYSQTDSEVFVNLIASQSGTVLQKLMKACEKVSGSFAVALLHKGDNKIYLARRHSPIMVAVDENGAMAGSDISVFAGRFEFCYILDDDEFAVMNEKNVTFFNKNGEKIKKNRFFIKNFDFFEEENMEKYFMLKEIKEQPVVLRRTYFKLFSEKFPVEIEKIKKFKSFHFIACGTAYHSCLLGARFVQEFCKKECKVSIASEFRYDNNIFSKNCLYVFVSQSGETADTIACASLVKEHGMSVMCVTNVPYCSLNKIADFILPTYAGREVAVASTKAYTAQVFTLLIFALKIAGMESQRLRNFVQSNFLESFDEKLISQISSFKKIFFIGRQQDYVTALEGALKLKEIAYINCLGLPAGELKHGTLALIDDETLVVAISTQKNLKEKMESNILEIKARGGKIFLLSNFKHDIHVEYFLSLPDFEQFLMPIVSIFPLQRLAFEMAVKLGYNPDKPRNLAKSVTVE